ncbi:hypothetical protein SNOG_15998 [Parastagonospora nodorum SN15]|nr:hypothetical protein SNOG_15998 [Parastagonospora nodorum SN15]EAT76577.1 hypothetical protein SNOG_15998 [Parastagonospora nodorum SN15]
MTRSGKVECQEEQQVAEERTHLDGQLMAFLPAF